MATTSREASTKRSKKKPAGSSPSGKKAKKSSTTATGKAKATRPTSNERCSKYSNPTDLQPFRWRDPRKLHSTEAERQVAVDHICKLLSRGGVELIWICYHVMVPVIPKPTLHEWREKHPEWNQAIEDAFEVGGASDMLEIKAIVDAVQPLQYGHTTFAQRAQHKADVRRDRLRAWQRMERVKALHRRYRDRHILEGDKDNPLIPSTFMIQPVRAKPMDERPADPSEEE